MSTSPSQISELPDGFAVEPDAAELETGTTESLTRGRLILRRFLRRKTAIAAVLILLGIVLIAYLGPYLTHWKYDDLDQDNVLAGPSSSHYFGVDDIGRDVYARTLRGLQKSLIIGFAAAVLTTGLAAIAGSIAGYFGRFVDTGVVWVIDLFLTLPSFLMLAILSPVLAGKTWLWLVLLLSLFGWMITGRVVRGMTLSLKERDYIHAAKFMGVAPFTIIKRHLLPNMASLLIVDVTINVGLTILGETTLSFFGFGVQAPDVSLGTVLGDSENMAQSFPHMFLPAGLTVIVLVLCVSVIGDALRDAIDPTSGSSHL
jgi:peptide/nickel transport system permease protein